MRYTDPLLEPLWNSLLIEFYDMFDEYASEAMFSSRLKKFDLDRNYIHIEFDNEEYMNRINQMLSNDLLSKYFLNIFDGCYSISITLAGEQKSDYKKIDVEKCFYRDDIPPPEKSVFNSDLEKRVYFLLVRKFPNFLVFPNVSMQSIFDYEKMKAVNKSLFSYYLRASVDFCIVSVDDYRPVYCIEIDSHYHDQARVKTRDFMKNILFYFGAKQLIRIRFNEYNVTDEQISAAIDEAVIQA